MTHNLLIMFFLKCLYIKKNASGIIKSVSADNIVYEIVTAMIDNVLSI